jgi:glycosyltransferase involved in cell wall biosynthesis
MSLEYSSVVSWHYFISKKVAEELGKFNINTDEKRFKVFRDSPAKSVKARKTLKTLTDIENPDVVFTFFGPAYVKFRQPHLCGVADGLVTHSTWQVYKSMKSLSEKVVTFLRCVYKGYWYRFSNRWVVEAECAKNGLTKRMLISPNSIDVVKNTCGQHYFTKVRDKFNLDIKKRYKILTLSSYHPHKNLEIIPRIARSLVERGIDDFVFIVTIQKATKEESHIFDLCSKMGIADCVVNIGPVNIVDGPALYAACDIVLQPSLLETFSANYPEAMSQKRPIVTTDLDFARDICVDAALYYSARDPESAADCIQKLIYDGELAKELVRNGEKILSSLPSAKEKYLAYENIIKRMAGMTEALCEAVPR